MSFSQGATIQMSEFPRTQLASSDPKKWDAEWEKIFQTDSMRLIMCNVERLFHIQSRFKQPLLGVDAAYEEYRVFLISTCTIQQRIGVWSFLHRQEIETKWTSSFVSEREKQVLLALSHICAMARNLNEARAYCARELRLHRLSKDPRVLLSLLDSIVPGKEYLLKPPETPYYIPNEEWDELSKKQANGTEAEKVAFQSMLMLRTKLICTHP